MDRWISNLLSGASGLLLLVPVSSVAQVRPVTDMRSDAEALRADVDVLAADFNKALVIAVNEQKA